MSITTATVSNYILLRYFIYGNQCELFFIPEDDFKQLFILDQKHGIAYENKNYTFEAMSGGFDGFLQSCWLNHIRSDVKEGDWSKMPKNIIGCYQYSRRNYEEESSDCTSQGYSTVLKASSSCS